MYKNEKYYKGIALNNVCVRVLLGAWKSKAYSLTIQQDSWLDEKHNNYLLVEIKKGIRCFAHFTPLATKLPSLFKFVLVFVVKATFVQVVVLDGRRPSIYLSCRL